MNSAKQPRQKGTFSNCDKAKWCPSNFRGKTFCFFSFFQAYISFSLWTCDIDRPTELWEQMPISLHVILGAPHSKNVMERPKNNVAFTKNRMSTWRATKMKKKTEKPALDVETDHLPQTHLCWILSSIVFLFPAINFNRNWHLPRERMQIK